MTRRDNLCELSDLVLYQGDYKEFEVYVTKEQKDVILDTVKVRFVLCDINDESVVIFTKMGTNSTGSNKSIIKVTTSDTQNLQMTKYIYKIEIEYNTGDKNIGKGYFTIV